MVSNAVLAAICVSAGLHEHLLFDASLMQDNLEDYVDRITERQEEAHRQAQQDGQSPGQYWVDVEPPKALSDVIESIIGALYVSDNFSPLGAERFYEKVLKPFYDQHITLETLSHHPTKVLFERIQSESCQNFSLVKEEIDPKVHELGHTIECKSEISFPSIRHRPNSFLTAVIIHDVILSSTTDTSVSACARRAADMALDAIDGDPSFLAQTCNCRELALARKAAKKNGKPAG
jgi:endoribonuclease Dicer